MEKDNIDLCHVIRYIFIIILKFKYFTYIKLNQFKALIYGFTLLQDCLSIEQFDLYLSDLFNLFNNPIFDESVEESLKVCFIIKKKLI